MNNISEFQLIIKEFHERGVPAVKPRDLKIPDINKIICIYGPRRTGKTYYLYYLMNILLSEGTRLDQIIYINLEDDRLFPFSDLKLTDLISAYYKLYPNNLHDTTKFFFLDEIQNIPNWELFVRRIYDTENIRIFITGSSSKIMFTDITTSIRGRALSYLMLPLSFPEFLRFNEISIDKNDIYGKNRFLIQNMLEKYINSGGYPEIISMDFHRDILTSYYNIMLLKDIAQRFHIRNITLLKLLSQYLMKNISTKFSLNSYLKSIKNQYNPSRKTLSDYYSYLLEINMFFEIKYFSYSLKTQQNRPVKIYSVDNGLRNAVSFKFSSDFGVLMENLVMVELKRRGKEVFYWNSNKSEVDFIYIEIQDNDITLYAINVTDDRRGIKEREYSGLNEFASKFSVENRDDGYEYKRIELILISMDTEKFESNINIIPLWKWLLDL